MHAKPGSRWSSKWRSLGPAERGTRECPGALGLSGKQRDELSGYLKEAGDAIAESMFTESEMRRGNIDSHEEARRSSSPCIKVPGALAAMAGIQVDKRGLVSRDQALRMWKIGRRALGEDSNAEKLRRMG